MISFFKDNTWILSIVAIAISLISATFVIIDRIKAWREISLVKKLKKDKAILHSIIELKAEDFSTIELKESENSKLTIHQPKYSSLYHIIQRLDTSNLSNNNLSFKIDNLKKLEPDDLFEIKNIPNGNDFSVQFSMALIEVINDSRKHLANVI